MGILRPYLRSARKIEWDSVFGKILGGPERKMKISETRRGGHEPVGSATPTRRAGDALILIFGLDLLVKATH